MNREYWIEWRRKNPHKDKEYYDKTKATPEKRIKQLLRATTVDRSLLSYEFIWTRLESNGFKCEITGIPFNWESRSPTGLSIDRIDPALPYTPENIRLVCWWINAAMGNWGLDKLKELIKEWNDYKSIQN